MKILYFENHAIFAQQVCQQILFDHDVTVVPDLKGARAALKGEQFDLLIIDYDLDDGKGDDLVRTCRACLPELPIIGSSSHDAGNAALLKAGASAICGKVEFDRIRDVINTVRNC